MIDRGRNQPGEHDETRARNQLKGKVVSVDKGAVNSTVKIDIGGTVITAMITNQSVSDLGLAPGTDAYAVVKASDVIVGVD